MSMVPKSNSLYVAYETAKKDALNHLSEPVPLVIRNGVTKLMKELDYGKGYKYAHDYEDKLTDMQCLPDSLIGREYYKPTEQGVEKKFKERLREIKEWKKKINRFMSKEVDLGREPVKHLLFILAVPAITSQVVNALYNMVDRMYIGHIEDVGSEALTGVGICFPIIMIISAFAYLVGMGGAPRASIFMGKGDKDSAERILGNCFSALIVVALLLTAVTLIFLEPLLYLFGASENTIGYAKDYMVIYAAGTIFVQVTLGLNAFISAQGFSKISMMTVIIGAVTNIILDPILIFALGMGVKGAAVATVISQAISAAWAYAFLHGENTILKIKKENLRIKTNVLLPCIGLGIAPFIMTSTESLLVLCFNSSLLKYGGDLAVGAMTILSGIMQFAMLPMQGLTQGGQPIISYNYGAKNKERVKEAFRLQTICTFTYAGDIVHSY